MICYLFNSEADGRANQNRVWVNLLDDLSATKLEYYRRNNQPLTFQEFDALSDAEKLTVVLEGGLKGMVVEKGRTVAFSDVLQRYDAPEYWFFPKPDIAAWRTGVVAAGEAEFQDGWLPPINNPDLF